MSSTPAVDGGTLAGTENLLWQEAGINVELGALDLLPSYFACSWQLLRWPGA